MKKNVDSGKDLCFGAGNPGNTTGQRMSTLIVRGINNMRKSSLYAYIAVITIFLVALSIGSSVNGEELSILQNFKRGEKLPSLELPSINGGHARLFTPENGKPSVIMFFSVRPDFRKKRSLALLSTLSVLADQYKAKINIVSIYSDSQEISTVKTYMDLSTLNVMVYNDSQKKVYNTYGVFMMPLVVMTDGEGKLHEVIPYTYNIMDIVDGNIKYLLGEWGRDELIDALKPKSNIVRSKTEKEYIRRVNYGRIMQAKKMYGQAIREFSTAVKLQPRLIEGHIGLGLTLLKTQKYDRAEAAFREALKISPQSDDAVAGLGLAYYGRNELDTALVELEKAFIAPEPHLEVVIALASIYEGRGNHEKANRLNKLAVSKLMSLYEQRWK